MTLHSILKSVPVNTFDALSPIPAAPFTGTEFALPARATSLQWQTFFGTNPAAVSIELEFSLDGTHWDAVDVSSAVGGEIRTFAFTGAKFVRGRVASITNGDELTMMIHCN